MSARPFLVISYAIPDRASGTPVVIRKFLQNFNENELILMGRPVARKERIGDYRFHYPTVKIPTPPVGFRGEKLWKFLSVIFGVVIGLYVVLTKKPGKLLAFYRDESSLLTGYLLHKITGLPLYSYFCDIYLENFPKGVYKKLAAWLQPRVFRDSTRVIVLTEAMRDYYKHQYQVDAIVLPHCNNEKVIEVSPGLDHREVIRIGYLGMINIDRINSLQVLCKGIQDNESYELIYFSPTLIASIQKMGLLIKNASVRFIADNNLLMCELQTCDFLFLPLTQPPGCQGRTIQVETGFPTKVIEYLLAQVPIVVHSDKDSFAAKFLEEHHCAYVIYGDSGGILNAFQKIHQDPFLKDKLIMNSIKTLAYFDGKAIANTFRELIK